LLRDSPLRARSISGDRLEDIGWNDVASAVWFRATMSKIYRSFLLDVYVEVLGCYGVGLRAMTLSRDTSCSRFVSVIGSVS
jgi:hypothetical protein